MRQPQPSALSRGEIDISKIPIDARSRDDIPAILKGLQLIYTNADSREQLFGRLEQSLKAKVDVSTGRPGMTLWRIFVLATLKQGLGCDFDRLQELAHEHRTLRQILGHSGDDEGRYPMQTLVDNVSLLTPEVLAEINQLVVEVGHEVVKKNPGDGLCGRCDSFVVETDVHYPTDANLLWDAMRVVLREVGRSAQTYGVKGWRQWHYHSRSLKQLFRRTQKLRRSSSKNPERQAQKREQLHQAYRDYLGKAEQLLEKVEYTLPELLSGGALAEVATIEPFIAHAQRQIDQISRRVLQEHVIPHDEKVLSIFEPHTRWLCKGKAGVAVELGVAVCVLEDQYQFILHHRILWAETDDQVAVAMVKETQARYPNLRQCSFDRAFYSPDNRRRLDELLDHNIMPKKGRLSQVDKERQCSEPFVKARYQHAAVESCINNLEQRGLDRCRAHGKGGFERTVALSIVAANVHRLGLLLQRREKKRLLRHQRRQAALALAA